MTETPVPLPPEVWEATPPESQALIVALQAELRELRARLGQDSSNSSRPPSSDPPQAPAKAKRQQSPTGRQRGGQPGHPGHFRALLPVDQVDQVVAVAPEACRHCGLPFPSTPPRRRARAWRHQVVELVGKLTVQVTEYQMHMQRCSSCGKRTRAELPVGAHSGWFGPKLVGVAAMLLGKYRLSRREVQRLVADLWDVPVSLGGVVRIQQLQSAALEPVYAEVRQAVQQAAVVNMDETGWREDKRRAWLWTVVTSALTVFHIDRSRGGVVVEALLGTKFTGVVGSDRWSAYNRFPATQRAVCYAHLKRDFQALIDRGGTAETIGRWGLTELERLFALWHRFRMGEFNRKEWQRRLVPLRARMGRLLWRGEDNPDHKVAGLCRDLNKRWEALWTFTKVEGLEPTNNVSERALRPAVL
jgi:transposase